MTHNIVITTEKEGTTVTLNYSDLSEPSNLQEVTDENFEATLSGVNQDRSYAITVDNDDKITAVIQTINE